MTDATADIKKITPTSTVGRGNVITFTTKPEFMRWSAPDPASAPEPENPLHRALMVTAERRGLRCDQV